MVPLNQVLILLFSASLFKNLQAASIAEGENDFSERTDATDATLPQTHIPKCCPLGEALLTPTQQCVPSGSIFNPLFTGPEPEHFSIVVGKPHCAYGMYRLEPKEASEDEFHLLANGTLSVPFQTPSLHSPSDYCLEDTLVNNELQTVPFICFPPPTDEVHVSGPKVSLILFPIGIIISIPLLALVAFVYLGIGELRTKLGVILAGNSGCLVIAYLSLLLDQLLKKQLTHPFCEIIAFIKHFCFLCYFFGSIFGSLQFLIQLKECCTGRKYNSTTKKTLSFLYPLCGWGIPLLVTGVSLGMYLMMPVSMENEKDDYNLFSCWFRIDEAIFPYFYYIVTFALSITMILFIANVLILKKSGSSILKQITELEPAARVIIRQGRKHWIIQAFLLLLVSGLTWLFEVISWAVRGPQEVWLLTDILNTLQGVIVFYTFVLGDPEVRNLCLQYFRRICCCVKDNSRNASHEDDNCTTHQNSIINGFPSQEMQPLNTLKENDTV